MNKRSVISLGLPVYNGGKYLTEAMESILAQTFEDFELIITDNASVDQTEQICRGFAKSDRRISYYRNETNLGAAKNYNRVFCMSAGKYFKWVSHDDICAPMFLEQCLETIECESAKTVLCYPRTILIDEAGNELRKYDDKMDIQFSKAEQRLGHVFRNLWLCNAVFGLIRREALTKTGLIGNYPGSDVVLLAELSLLGQFREIKEFLFFRRIHSRMSKQANRTQQRVAEWFDPENNGKLILPKCKFFIEYLKMIRRSQLTPREKRACYKVVRDEYWNKYWRHMGGECKIFLRHKLSSLTRQCGVVK